MSVVNGQDVEASIVNAAFMSRISDTSTVGKVSLENANSTNIDDAQKFINDVATAVGTFENDTNANNYTSQVVIANGDTYKEAIEKLDVNADDQGNAIIDLQNDLVDHTSDALIHFSENSINHENILNIGTNSHADIDSHIASIANPHSVTKTQVGLGNVTDDAQLKRAAADINSFTAKTVPVGADVLLIEDSADGFAKKKVAISNFPTGVTDHTALTNIGVNTHAQIDTHIASTSNPHSVTKTQVGLGNVTDDAQLKRADGDFNTFTLKATPASADLLLIEDSAASFTKKKVEVSSLGQTPVVVVSASLNGNTFPASGLTNLTGWTAGINYISMLNVTTGLVTIPEAGTYEFAGNLVSNSTTSWTKPDELSMVLDGGNRIATGFATNAATTTFSLVAAATPIAIVCTAGQTFQLQSAKTGIFGGALVASNQYSRVVIKKVK